MDDLFLVLILLSILGIIIGLVKPSVFSTILGNKATRKGTSIIFSGAFVVFFILFGISVEPIDEVTEKSKQNIEIITNQKESLEENGQQKEVTVNTNTEADIIAKDADSKKEKTELGEASVSITKSEPTDTDQLDDSTDSNQTSKQASDSSAQETVSTELDLNDISSPQSPEESETTNDTEARSSSLNDINNDQKWYVSSHWSSEYYYCEDSDGWKSLSKTYLQTYNSESELLVKFPNHTLHESCL